MGKSSQKLSKLTWSFMNLIIKIFTIKHHPFNIPVKPNCSITRKEINDEDNLICTADGNPNVVNRLFHQKKANQIHFLLNFQFDFVWLLKSENDTSEATEKRSTDTASTSSFLILEEQFTVMRVYKCVANNSVGVGSVCEIEVQGKTFLN